MTVNSTLRVDFEVIADLVPTGAKVLDVGSGDGSLLELLIERRSVDGRGLELSQQGVNECVARGLSVVQGDADHDLIHYPDQSFDYVILSQTIQATHNPRKVLEQLMRIGRHAIVSFPNFGYWRVRSSLMFRGRMPVTRDLPYSWYDTPNIHFCTLQDFVSLCRETGAHIERVEVLNGSGQKIAIPLPWAMWNLFGQQAVFLLTR